MTEHKQKIYHKALFIIIFGSAVLLQSCGFAASSTKGPDTSSDINGTIVSSASETERVETSNHTLEGIGAGDETSLPSGSSHLDNSESEEIFTFSNIIYPPERPFPSQAKIQANNALAFLDTLQPGWNLISIPEELASTDPATVLASIDGNYTQVVAYDGCDTADPWKLYDPSDLAGSDLTTIDPTMGLWIEMTVSDTLSVTGTIPTNPSINLCTGWNLIGYPSADTTPVGGAFSSIQGQYERVFDYQATNLTEPWNVYDVAVPSWANDLANLQPGRGYWVLATENVSWIPSSGSPQPTVAITSPANSNEITAWTTITGTVTSDVLSEWTLEYRLESDDTWVPFATGTTPVAEAALGTFDPTLLLNGIYKIRLTATDLFNQTTSTTINTIVDGELKIGHFTISLVDMAVPVSGIPIQIIRTYDSRDKRVGDFGVGWTLDIRDVRVEETGVMGADWHVESIGGFPPVYCIVPSKPHIVTVAAPDGTLQEFEPVLTPQCDQNAAPDLVDLTFEPLPGTYSSLTSLAGTGVLVQPATTGVELVGAINGTVYDAEQYVLTLRDGREFRVQQGVGLQSVLDLNGNSLIIDNDGIAHSSGMGIAFERDAEGRIVRITDPSGSTIEYAYDANGDLVSVTDQISNTTQFFYNNTHNMIDIIGPDGNRVALNEYAPDNRLIATVDADGNRVEFTHNINDGQEIVRDRLGNETIIEYDDSGNVLSETDAMGNTTTYTYDDRGNVLTQTDALGRTITRTFDAFDNVLTQVDVDGHLTTFTYNDRDQMLTMTDDRGRIITNAFDANGNLTQVTDGEGETTTFAYDASGNRLSMTDVAGNVTSFSYDAFGNQTTMTDASGNITSYSYDTNNQPLTQTQTRTLPDGTQETVTTQFEYDNAGNLVRDIDPLGNAFVVVNNALEKPATVTTKNGELVTYEYDARGYPTRIVYPDGSEEQFTYDAEGRQLTYTDQDNQTTTYEYDALGRLVRTIYPDATSTATAYDALGRVISETNELGQTTLYGYGADLETITDALGNVTQRELDSDGNVVRQTDANGNVTTFTYDKGSQRHGEGRLIQTTYADGTTTQFTYDALGRLIAETDQAGNVTTFGYDAEGRLILVRDALGQETTYAYDELGNQTSLTDANGNITRFEYDSLGRMIKRILPLGQVETFAYDANGNQIAHTNFNGETITMVYDSQNRLVEKTWPDGTVETFAYSSAGLRLQAGGDTYLYDDRYRLITETKANGDTLSYTYDAAGNRTSVTTPAGITSYTYDALNRMETVTAPDGGVTSYTYDAVGNLQSVSLPNGIVTTYTFDNLNRLTLVKITNAAGGLLASYAYTLDDAGNRTQVVEAHTGRIVDYGYDATYRLISETIQDPVNGNRTITYTYDAVGNRLSKNDSVEGLTTYAYDANNRLLTENTPAGTITYGYDDNGNLISKNGPGVTMTYSYDAENRLIGVNNGVNTVEYFYDADSLRTKLVVDGTDVTSFLVDKNRPYAQVLRETDGIGDEIVSYVYGHDLLSQERLATGINHYLYDGQLSTRFLTDTSGNVINSYVYDAFGTISSSSGAITNGYLYTGEQLDNYLDAYYLRARYYDPNSGRFTVIDPFSGYQNDPQSLHKYVYGHNNPINNYDPTGEWSLQFWIAAFIVGGVSVSHQILPEAFYSNQDNPKLGLHQDLAVKLARNWALGMQLNYESYFERWFGIGDRRIVREAWWKTARYLTFEDIKFRRDTGCGVARVDNSKYSNTINLCEAYFQANLKGGFETRVGFIIHEVMHLADAADDQSLGRCKGYIDDQGNPTNVCYGPINASWLAHGRADLAVKNIDNYVSQAEYGR
ncbi:MAG: hypothetical protein H6657_15085 [Ardenticatenaceae bacterium]|nr:hypothetical protein [Ardenticatenaceae bacterium]